MTGIPRAAGKIVRLLGLLLIAVCLIPVSHAVGRRRTQDVMRWWYGRLLGALGIDVQIHGCVPDQATLIVSNHSTWLDIVVLGHVFGAVFISKSEVARWPVIGSYARVGGTLFLARGAFRTDETRQQIHDAIAAGSHVVLFPQGTTAVSPYPARFHARLFSAAVDHGDPVLPIALRYSNTDTAADCHHPDVPWVESSLLSNFVHVFRLPALHVDVATCPVITSHDHSRRSLAEASRDAIRQRLTDLSISR